jgi:hypothetical protein
MTIRAVSLRAWRAVRQRLQSNGQMTISKARPFPHPRDAGARPTVGWPIGQLADYALELEPGAPPLFIREFTDRFEAVVAGVALAEHALSLVDLDPAAALGLGGALLGAVIGASLTRKTDCAIVGAALGALLALAVGTYVQREVGPRSE